MEKVKYTEEEKQVIPKITINGIVVILFFLSLLIACWKYILFG